MVYNTGENKAELSALTYLPGQSGQYFYCLQYKRIGGNGCAVRRCESLYGFIFCLEVLNY